MRQRSGKNSSALSVLTQGAVRISGHLVGQLLPGRDGAPQVTFPGNPHGPIAARATVELPPAGGCVPVLLVFEAERSDLPIIVGVMNATNVAKPSEPVALRAPVGEALVDGKRVVLTAQEEIVLRCGKASITLRRNGRVVIRGAYVETRAEGVNRVKGGSVQIN